MGREGLGTLSCCAEKLTDPTSLGRAAKGV
jgi:hypothetical protein